MMHRHRCCADGTSDDACEGPEFPVAHAPTRRPPAGSTKPASGTAGHCQTVPRAKTADARCALSAKAKFAHGAEQLGNQQAGSRTFAQWGPLSMLRRDVELYRRRGAGRVGCACSIDRPSLFDTVSSAVFRKR